VLGLGTQHLLK